MTTRIQNLILIAVLVVADTVAVLGGWWLAYVLRIGGDFLPYYSPAQPEQYLGLILMSLPAWILIFALNRMYDRDELLGGPDEYGNVVKGCLIGFAALMAISVFTRTPDVARGWLVIGLVVTTFFVGSLRFLIRRAFYRMRPRRWFVQRALVVGTNADARAIARQLTPFAQTGVQVVGFVDDYLPVGTPIVDGLRVVAATPTLHAYTLDQRIDQVILISGAMAWESFDQLLRGITLSSDDTYAIKLSPGLYETLTTGVRVSYKNRVPLLEIERAPVTGIDALLKGTLDAVLLLASLVVVVPLILIIGPTLFLLGRRPIIRPYPAMGKNGNIFKTYRFQAIGPFDDERVWSRGRAFGRFLFASGLDKLPQFWNVARLQMSMVGPRPVDPATAGAYREWLPNLLSLRPGLTGARASSVENEITLEQEMRLELYYARNYSIWFDLQILFQTIVRMIKRQRVVRKPDTDVVATRIDWRGGTLMSSENL